MRSREELAWAAGLFEGEGAIVQSKAPGGRLGLRVAIQSTDRDVLDRFAAIVGCGRVDGPYQRKSTNATTNCKPIFNWQCNANRMAYAVIIALFPWLGERRRAVAAERIQVWIAEEQGPRR